MKGLQNLESPEIKRDVMKVLGCLGFYSCYIRNLHVDIQPLYELIKDTTPFKWADQHGELFKETNTRISDDTIMAVPSTKYPFHIHVDSSNAGTGCILVQQIPEGKRIVSFSSRVFDNAEHKMSTLHRELCGIVSALQTYERYIIRSPFPIYLYCDHKPILYLCGRKGQLPHRFFKHQVIIIKFLNLKIIWTPGSNLAFPDILSRNVTLSEANKLQLQHKENPHVLSFFDQDGHKVHYTIKHEEEQNATYNDFYPITWQQGNTRKTLRLKIDGNEHHVEDYLEDNEVLATMQDITDCFKLGKTINQFKQLCSSISPASSTSSLNEQDYSDIEQYDEESTDDETEIAEINIEIQDSDFRRDHSVAHELFRTKTKDKPILEKPISFKVFPHVDTSDLIQKLNDFANDADLDLQTLLEEQLNDPVLQVVRKWMKTSDIRPQKTPDINQSKALSSFYNKFEQLFIELDTNLLCYKEPIQDTCRTVMKICVPLSLPLPLFCLAHTHSHIAIVVTLENSKPLKISDNTSFGRDDTSR